MFPLDHEAKQEAFMVLRDEGRAFARTCSGKVLAFAEEPHYLMLSLVELDRSMRIDTVQVGENRVFRAHGARCSVDFVEKAAAWHRDSLREILEAGYDVDWPIYFQESRRNPSDRTPVPEERRYCIRPTAAGRCDFAASAG
jgi:predicted ATPase